MVIDIKEASKLMEFIKGMTPEVEEGIVEKMVGKFKGIVPEGKSSVEYLKELREKEYDLDPYDSIAFAVAESAGSEIFVTRDGKLRRNIRGLIRAVEPEEV